MPTIFINYRREDGAGYAGRIHERLASVFGSESVFIDLDDIPPGVDFVSKIQETVAACDVMLVLITRRWLELRDASGRRRIDDPADFVRIEIGKGLARNIRVIPVLTNNASMPAEKDLPLEIGQLADRQAIVLSDERWDYDISQLLKALAGPVAPTRRRFRQLAGMALGAAALLSATIALILWSGPSSPDLTGRWEADLLYDVGVRRREVFVFRMNDGVLGGTASFLGVERGIVDGKIDRKSDGTRVSFATHTEEMAGNETRPAEHQYRGSYDGHDIRFVMQTTGGFSPHAPVEFVATRAAPVSGPPTTNNPPHDSRAGGGDDRIHERPWSEARARLTLNDGRVVDVRAETLSNCISVVHQLNLAGGQSVDFEKLKSFVVLRAEPRFAPNARATLRLTLLNGTTVEDSVPANCDLFGYNDIGRFTTTFQDLRQVEFQR